MNEYERAGMIDIAQCCIKVFLNYKERLKLLELEKRAAQERALNAKALNFNGAQHSGGNGSPPPGALKALHIQEEIDDIKELEAFYYRIIGELEEPEQEILKAYCDGLSLHEYALKNHIGKSRKIKYLSDRALANFGERMQDNLTRR